jgi:hypothetical protein
MDALPFINTTPYAAEPLPMLDIEGRETLAILAQATFDIPVKGPLQLAEKQRKIATGGEWWGEPGMSSLRFEPQIAPWKPGTDIVLHGHAHPKNAGDVWVDAGIRLGNHQVVARVFGERDWLRVAGWVLSKAKALEPTPLIWENAFGGWDRTHVDPTKHRYEKRNPLGVGFGMNPGMDRPRVPRMESPEHLISTVGDKPPPVGFGFIGTEWEPRSKLAGTYDAKWQEDRMPLLPHDFNPRFFQCAPIALQTQKPLFGNELVQLIGVSNRGPIGVNLPSIPPPTARVCDSATGALPVSMVIDTVIIDTDAHQILLLWRGHAVLPHGLQGIESIELGDPKPQEPAFLFVPLTEEELAAEAASEEA